MVSCEIAHWSSVRFLLGDLRNDADGDGFLLLLLWVGILVGTELSF
jgi:hypothetical protein